MCKFFSLSLFSLSYDMRKRKMLQLFVELNPIYNPQRDAKCKAIYPLCFYLWWKCSFREQWGILLTPTIKLSDPEFFKVCIWFEYFAPFTSHINKIFKLQVKYLSKKIRFKWFQCNHMIHIHSISSQFLLPSPLSLHPQTKQ